VDLAHAAAQSPIAPVHCDSEHGTAAEDSPLVLDAAIAVKVGAGNQGQLSKDTFLVRFVVVVLEQCGVHAQVWDRDLEPLIRGTEASTPTVVSRTEFYPVGLRPLWVMGIDRVDLVADDLVNDAPQQAI